MWKQRAGTKFTNPEARILADPSSSMHIMTFWRKLSGCRGLFVIYRRPRPKGLPGWIPAKWRSAGGRFLCRTGRGPSSRPSSRRWNARRTTTWHSSRSASSIRCKTTVVSEFSYWNHLCNEELNFTSVKIKSLFKFVISIITFLDFIRILNEALFF